MDMNSKPLTNEYLNLASEFSDMTMETTVGISSKQKIGIKRRIDKIDEDISLDFSRLSLIKPIKKSRHYYKEQLVNLYIPGNYRPNVVINEKRNISIGPGQIEECVDLYFKLVRDLDKDSLINKMNNILHTRSEKQIVALIVLIFQTRDVREGKGERELVFNMFLHLFRFYPGLCCGLISLFEKYGRFKDIVELYYRSENILKSYDQTYNSKNLQGFLGYIRNYICCKIAEKEKSLLWKWLPREGSGSRQSRCLARKIALQAFPSKNPISSFKKYRKFVASFNIEMGTVEIDMCSKNFSKIKPASVPGRCLIKNKDAFFNYQNSFLEDRIICAENFTNHFKKGGKVHGQTMHVDELVEKCIQGKFDSIIQGSWEDIRRKFADLGLGKYVALSDVSGSMNGKPMIVSIGLGILISELTHKNFKNRFITFHESPTWHILPENGNLKQKVESAQSARWGGTTNFMEAIRLILETGKKYKIAQDDMPEGLVVLSDMQMNMADRSIQGTSLHQTITNLCAKYGYKPFRIIYWNLRGNTLDFPCKSDQEGVDFVSGFSQNLLSSFVNGSYFGSTPEKTFYSLIDDKRYDDVRNIIFSSEPGSKILGQYIEMNNAVEETYQRVRGCWKTNKSITHSFESNKKIPLEFIGHVKGKKGSNIKKIQKKTKTNINIDKYGNMKISFRYNSLLTNCELKNIRNSKQKLINSKVDEIIKNIKKYNSKCSIIKYTSTGKNIIVSNKKHIRKIFPKDVRNILKDFQDNIVNITKFKNHILVEMDCNDNAQKIININTANIRINDNSYMIRFKWDRLE